jgi:hypothetical protein
MFLDQMEPCQRTTRMNQCSLALLLMSILASGATLSQATNLDLTCIIGGSEADEDRYSYAVLLQGLNGTACGGSLITRDILLMAVHCFGLADIRLVGRHDLNDGNGELFATRAWMPHPKFGIPILADNNIMLVFLAGASTIGDVITIGLNSYPLLPGACHDVMVMGWGLQRWDYSVHHLICLHNILHKLLKKVRLQLTLAIFARMAPQPVMILPHMQTAAIL